MVTACTASTAKRQRTVRLLSSMMAPNRDDVSGFLKNLSTVLRNGLIVPSEVSSVRHRRRRSAGALACRPATRWETRLGGHGAAAGGSGGARHRGRLLRRAAAPGGAAPGQTGVGGQQVSASGQLRCHLGGQALHLLGLIEQRVEQDQSGTR